VLEPLIYTLTHVGTTSYPVGPTIPATAGEPFQTGISQFLTGTGTFVFLALEFSDKQEVGIHLCNLVYEGES
jgi:hypothetical protein